jgi:CBS domain-containing protein
MKLQHILSSKAPGTITILPSHSVREAIDILVERNIGALLVVSDGLLAGILTERDILRVCSTRYGEIDSLTVRDLMTTDLIIGQPDDEVEYTMSVMTDRHIRHMPVMDGASIVGMISIGDLVKSQLQEGEVVIRHLKDYITGNTR